MLDKSLERRHILRPPKQESRSALFLDRDGVLVDDVHYLSDPEKVRILPGVNSLLELALTRRWGVVIITNQSGISRGLFDWKAYDAVTERMLANLKYPEAIDAIYANGYGPNQQDQPWRKPNPGMLVDAALELGIDLAKSVLIGDRLSDIKAGKNANVKTLVHVRTGHGENERSEVIKMKISVSQSTKNQRPDIYTIDDLTDFPGIVLPMLSSQA